MEKILYAIPDLCTGCNRCTYICSAVKEGKFYPTKSRIHINNFTLNGYSVPSVCFQCPKPECLEACPEEAIYKDENKVVLVDRKKCNGCGDCVAACPYGMIEQDAEKLAYKCDYCGGDPACVTECAPGAIVFQAEDKQLRKLRGLQMKQRTASPRPDEKRHQLGLNLMSKDKWS
jgi:carbon-monoxide dehydrogenase iron sulfur subunit